MLDCWHPVSRALTGGPPACAEGPPVTHEEKLELDVYYVENRTFLLDVRLMLLTFWNVLFRRDNIYECEKHGG
ncbi:hypothetical protein LCGC14_2296320 [marine sediment metagenome]|uniref:Uncharacterized protein n=1 Tax=marine sediment metagenome TaxID=412755 RepID=A0A0F9CPS9_9ZZZZ